MESFVESIGESLCDFNNPAGKMPQARPIQFALDHWHYVKSVIRLASFG